MYNLKIANVPVDVYNADQYNLLLATGVEFDVWTYANKTVDQAYDTGLIRELPIEMIQTYGPEFINIFEETSSTWTSLSTVDGKTIMVLPMYSASFGLPHRAFCKDRLDGSCRSYRST